MLTAIPLMIVSFSLYNLITFGGSVAGTDPLLATMFSMQMMSGGQFTLTMGDVVVLVSLVMLFFEIMKSTRTTNASVLDHLLSTGVFILFLVEFLLVKSAATGVFFIIMVMALIDVLAGFSVSIRSASRDVNYN